MKQLNILLVIVGIFLIGFNFFVIYQFGIQESRWAMALSNVIFFVVYFKLRSNKNKLLMTSFALLVFSGFIVLRFETPYLRKAAILLVILAYAALIWHIIPYVKNLKINTSQKLLLTVIILINSVMLMLLLDMVEIRIDDIYHSSMFFFYGFAMILLLIFAFSYTYKYPSRSSFYFACAVLGFVFSDISGFIAYNLQVKEFYFPNRALYLLGLMSLVKYASLDKSRSSILKTQF